MAILTSPAPAGESFRDFEARVLEEVNELLDREPESDRGGDPCGRAACGLEASVRLLGARSLATNSTVLLRRAL